MTRSIALTVNGEKITAHVEPRMHLADFLRGDLGLTGTHLGCEQGVCGACTVIIDGKPARSCITFAAACDGAEVTTIEGLDDDPLARDLRENFSRYHGLQCGFCTPGMLVVARDLILRHGACDEAKVREDLSGNLCRCTGYMGIVTAVQQTSVGRAPAAAPAVAATTAAAATTAPAGARTVPAAAQATSPSVLAATGADGWSEITQTVAVALKPDAVWAALKDIRRIVQCVPGAELDHLDGDAFRGRMVVKFGPIRASFAGDGTVTFDDATRTGLVTGAGRDTGSGSNVTGDARFAVQAASDAASRIDLTIRYRMTGMLAQFSRGALVKDLVGRITELFAQNLAASAADPGRAPARQDLGGFGLVWALVRARLRALFGG